MLTALCAGYGLRWAVQALRTHLRLAPRAAAGDAAARESVTQRPEAGLFGVPNGVYGSVYYSALLLLSVTRRLDTPPWRGLARLAALAALVRTVTLLIALARTRTWCAVCMRAHLANLILAVLIVPARSRHER